MEKIHQCPVCKSANLNACIQTAAQMHPAAGTFNFDQCADCQLVFLNPRLNPNELMQFYTDFYLPYRGSKAWGKHSGRVEQSQVQLDLKRASLLNNHHPIGKDSLILDVGCGKPSFLNTCVKKYGCKAIGLDFTDEGWKSNSKAYQNLKLITGEIKDLPKDLIPDVITMWHYLEHDYDPANTLVELRKRTHAQTTLIIEVPNYESEGRKKFGKDWAGYHTPRHISLFSPKNLSLLLENTGWKVKEVNAYGTLDPYVLYWMSRMEKKGIDWSQSMENEFLGFVLGMMAFRLKSWPEKSRSLGIMTAIAVPA
ncbi:MAG: class I SAM-dependent methyltransferase [Bacteroidetes bacterium]|nr:class I SAM-dependent methyltransferase [Bacteroidota bacterium]